MTISHSTTNAYKMRKIARDEKNRFAPFDPGDGSGYEPHLCEDAISEFEYLVNADSNARVLEFGAGHSTIWLASRVKSIISVETRPSWIEYIRSKVTNRDVFSARLAFITYDYNRDDFTMVESLLTGREFDICYVDGPDRESSLRLAHGLVASGGWLIVDDSGWSNVSTILEEELIGWGKWKTYTVKGKKMHENKGMIKTQTTFLRNC